MAGRGDKAGHALNNALLRKLFATDGAWAWADAVPAGVTA